MVKKSFCDGWKFRKQGTENVTDVIVPHDAMLHGVRSKDEPSGSAGASVGFCISGAPPSGLCSSI